MVENSGAVQATSRRGDGMRCWWRHKFVNVTTRSRTAAVLCALTLGSVPATFASAAEAVGPSCAAPSITFAESSASTIAPGVTAIAGRVGSGAGGVQVHFVRVDLSRNALRVLGRGASGSLAVSKALEAVPNGIAAVNGDLFHVTRDGSSVTPDGSEADQGTVVKAGAGAPDALTVSSGVAAISSPQFAGTVTIADGPTPAGPVSASTSPPHPSTVRHAPAKRSRHPKHVRKHPRHRKHRTHRKRPKHPVAPRPVAGVPHWPAGSVVIVPGTGGSLSAVATLNGVNNVDGGTGAVLVTPSWGSATLADQLPSDAVEVVTDGAHITAIRTDAPVVPDPGSTALLLSAQNRQKVPWLAVGDAMTMQVALNTPIGPAQVAIGGNARLVTRAVIDPSCTLIPDDTRRPRVAAGTYANGHMLVLLVSDGDTSDEPGLTFGELAVLMHKIGADDALNLDGGRSSTLDEKISGQWQEVNNGPGDRWVANVLAVVPR